MPLIEVDHVSKFFRIPSKRRETLREHALDLFRPRPSQLLPVLDDVSLHMNLGETMGIMGRNGAGKSTLLKIIAGVYVPDRGTVVVRGPITPILDLGVGWNPGLDAIDNILLIGTVLGFTLADLKRSTPEILAFAGLEAFANLKLKYYSQGMSARLAYAVAFNAVHDILILDEIFAVGDVEFQTRCRDRYRELRAAGHSVVVTTHDPTIVLDFCDRAVLLGHGHVLHEGTPAEVVERYHVECQPKPDHSI